MKYNALLLTLPFVCLAAPAMAAPDPVRIVSVTGTAREEVAPNQAILSGQLVSKSKELEAAKKANDELVERVVVIAKQFEIPREKISAANVYISPEYVYNKKTGRQDMVGYIITRNLTITIDKIGIHEQVLSALVENGIDQVNGVNFQVSNPEARADTLRARAVQDAKNRAEILAKAAGAKLGRVYSIATDGASMVPPPMPRMMMANAAAKAESSVAPSLPGMTTMQETVSVSFELE